MERKDYEFIGKEVRFAPSYDGWYSAPEEVVESFRGITGTIDSVKKDMMGNTSVVVDWDKPTPGLGKYFRTGFGASENCSCVDCKQSRRPDLEFLSNDSQN